MLKKITSKFFYMLLNKEKAKKIILLLVRKFNLDLRLIYYNQIGILNYQNGDESGEFYFINKFLKDKFSSNFFSDKLILFDVGANIGKYSTALSESFKNADVYTFEPNLNSYKILEKNLSHLKDLNIHLLPVGLSSKKCELEMTTYSDNPESSHTSINSKIFTDFHNSNNNISFLANFTTLDLFCSENNINHIDLLKIDTEGHELDVLKGAKELLANQKIRIIQFEFGECNVYSRVYLKDFYDLLSGFQFYRLLKNNLLPLGGHSPSNEIFQFQNIIAIHDKDLN